MEMDTLFIEVFFVSTLFFAAMTRGIKDLQRQPLSVLSLVQISQLVHSLDAKRGSQYQDLQLQRR